MNNKTKPAIKENFNPSAKTFKVQESTLSNTFSRSKFVYNSVIAMLITVVVETALESYVKYGELNLHLKIFFSLFKQIHIAIALWVILFLISLVCYPAFKLWVNLYIKILSSPSYSKYLSSFNIFSICLTFIYYTSILAIPTMGIYKYDLQIFPSIIILCEEIRLLMKIHSYLRTNVPNILKFKQLAKNYPTTPKFKHYMYYQFAPTLLYRDEYPRTTSTDWYVVAKCILELCFALYMLCCLFDKMGGKFEHICLENPPWINIVMAIFQNFVWAFSMLIIVWYLVLHTWQTAFAEILRFGDRMFYQDWWNCESLAKYYRRWNHIVQDWLYTYVYLDLQSIMSIENTLYLKDAVFFISALFHEYIIGISLRIFFPVNFVVFFVTAVTGIRIKMEFGNMYFLLSLGTGFSMLFSFYNIGYYASRNCPIENPDIWDVFIPRVIRCNCLM